MTTSWDSLYLPSNSQAEVVAVLQEIMTALGYTRYDPFGGIPGKVYQQVLRLFVAPAHEGWVRILGRPDPRMLGALSQSMCLYLRLEGDTALIETYTSGYPRDALESLAPYRRDEIEALRRALYEDVAEAAPQEPSRLADSLPEDVQAMASRVNQKQAQKLIDRASRSLLDKVSQGRGSADLSSQARALIDDKGPLWDSAGGQRIQAVMACLNIPTNWREPDFGALRDAYQLHLRQQRKPGARLYPGDEAVMAQVANALDYVPVYGGCDD